MVNIVINSDPRYKVNKSVVQDAVIEALEKHHLHGKIEVSVSIVGDRKMHELNQKYRGIDSTTDILSFAFEDPMPSSLQHIPRVGFVAAPDQVLRLGDIVLSLPQVLEDAAENGTTVDEEIKFLLDHGVNHLLGIHHAEN